MDRIAPSCRQCSSYALSPNSRLLRPLVQCSIVQGSRATPVEVTAAFDFPTHRRGSLWQGELSSGRTRTFAFCGLHPLELQGRFCNPTRWSSYIMGPRSSQAEACQEHRRNELSMLTTKVRHHQLDLGRPRESAAAGIVGCAGEPNL